MSGIGPLKPSDLGPSGRGRRVALGVLGATALAGLGGAAWMLWPAGQPTPQGLGPRLVIPSPIRARVGLDELVFFLTRRSEQDATDPAGEPARRDRIALMALEATSLAPRFEIHLLSVPRWGMRDAALIGEQGATLWAWLGGIGALSAVDGRVLADQQGLEEINPGVPVGMPATSSAWRMGDALVMELAHGMTSWRFDPRDFRASPARGIPSRPLPAAHPAAPVGPGGPADFRVTEARIAEDWLGLPEEKEKLVGPLSPRGDSGRFLAQAAPAEGAVQALWRGEVQVGPAAPRNWPANRAERWGQGERLLDLAPVPELAGLRAAGFLTPGSSVPIMLPDPQSLLLLHGGEDGTSGLLRLTSDGRVLWRAKLPIRAVRSVLPGPDRILFLDGTGSPELADAVLVSVALADGTVTERRLSA